MATAKVLQPLFGVIIAVQRGDCAAAVARERRAGVNLTGSPYRNAWSSEVKRTLRPGAIANRDLGMIVA